MRSPVRVGLIVVGLMVLIAAFGALWEWRPWDARFGADATARALQQRLHSTVRYRCERADRDVPLKGADYVCAPMPPSRLPSFWVATDRNGITKIEEVS